MNPTSSTAGTSADTKADSRTTSRVQLALNVADLDSSIAFYSTLFGVTPHKLRPGYANFEVQNPPLKLVLIEVAQDERGTGTQGALNHLGVEVATTDEVSAAAAGLAAGGLPTVSEDATTCCYAVQDKVWVHDPAGTPWEVYTILDDDPAQATAPSGGCCADVTVAIGSAPPAAETASL